MGSGPSKWLTLADAAALIDLTPLRLVDDIAAAGAAVLFSERELLSRDADARLQAAVAASRVPVRALPAFDFLYVLITSGGQRQATPISHVLEAAVLPFAAAKAADLLLSDVKWRCPLHGAIADVFILWPPKGRYGQRKGPQCGLSNQKLRSTRQICALPLSRV